MAVLQRHDAQRRRERERDNAGDDDRDGDGHRELTVELTGRDRRGTRSG
jgi:hypothetical protein